MLPLWLSIADPCASNERLFPIPRDGKKNFPAPMSFSGHAGCTGETRINSHWEPGEKL